MLLPLGTLKVIHMIFLRTKHTNATALLVLGSIVMSYYINDNKLHLVVCEHSHISLHKLDFKEQC